MSGTIRTIARSGPVGADIQRFSNGAEMRRLFWVTATPLVHVGHRLGLWSYKWVNVCIGARLPASFDELWQHQWYGAPIARLPDDVNLCGIRYRTSASEGTVIFSDTTFASRILFERDPHDRMASLWYVTLSGTMPAPHVRAAYEWVCAVFGDSFVKRAASAVSRTEGEAEK